MRAHPMPPLTPPPAPDRSRELRRALGNFATGVTVVTCRDGDGEPVGVTINSFNALSLDPPLITWALGTASPSLAAFREHGRFAVNVLADTQEALARRFARRDVQRFDGVAIDWRFDAVAGPGRELPALPGVCAAFACRTVDARPWGDHVLFIGEVEHFARHLPPPLLFVHGAFRRIGAPTDA